MVVTEKEIETLVSLRVDIEKLSKVSSDGKNLLFLIPKEITEYLGLEKTSRLKWYVNLDRKVKLEVVR